MSIQESDGESSKENNLKGTINNTKPFCNCHIKLDIVYQIYSNILII